MKDSPRNIFENPAHYEQLERYGYVIVDLFNADEIQVFEEIFHQYFPSPPSAFFSSSYLPDFDLKKQISSEIESILLPKLTEHFKDYRCLGAAFLSKAPDPNSELPMHQDWTIVDESKYLAANIWTPITPLTVENGTLEVLPGSHKTFRSLRAPTLPFSGNNLRDQIKKHLTPLLLKPGQVAVLDQALVHYSQNNRSDKLRLAFTTGIVSKEAPLHFSYWNKDTSELETLLMDDDFLFRWENFHQDIFQRPCFGTTIEKKPFVPELFGEVELQETIGVTKSELTEHGSLENKDGFSLSRILKRLWGQ